jgi:hypothetical protein
MKRWRKIKILKRQLSNRLKRKKKRGTKLRLKLRQKVALRYTTEEPVTKAATTM